MSTALVETALNAHDRKRIERADQTRLVKIDTGGVSAMDFGITREEQQMPYDNGYRGAKDFLKTWSFDAYREARRSGP